MQEISFFNDKELTEKRLQMKNGLLRDYMDIWMPLVVAGNKRAREAVQDPFSFLPLPEYEIFLRRNLLPEEVEKVLTKSNVSKIQQINAVVQEVNTWFTSLSPDKERTDEEYETLATYWNKAKVILRKNSFY